MHIQILNYILSSKYKTSALVILTGIVFYVLNFIWPIPVLNSLSGGIIIPDLLPMGGTIEYINNLFNSLGGAGRSQYLLFLYTLDFIFPILYSLFFGMLMWASIRNVYISEYIKYILVSFSFIAACFDYIENIATIIMLNTFPAISHTIVHIASISTTFKNTFSTIGIILIIGFSIYNTYHRFYLTKK